MTATEKAIPENILDNLLLPNRRYNYFEGSHEHPFNHQSNRFEMINAWWLAEAAFLAYAQPEFAQPFFKKAGLAQCRFFSGDSTQCYVVHNDDFVIVAFRGSEHSKREGMDSHDLRYIIADWVANSRTDLVSSGQRGFVHQGFKQALDEVWDRKALKSHLDEISNEGSSLRPVWFTGHSLGAALATLAANWYGNVAGLYTFGSPLVGDGAFTGSFRFDNYRFVNSDDIVTKVPSFGLHWNGVPRPGLYRHVGGMKYIDQQGSILDAPSVLARVKNNLRTVTKNTFDYLRYLRLRFRLRLRQQDPQELELARTFLTDHAPIYYAVHTWNSYARKPHS